MVCCSSNKCMVICTANYHCMYNKGERERERQERERGGERKKTERERGERDADIE